MNIFSKFFKREKQTNSNFLETKVESLFTHFTSEPNNNHNSKEIIYIEGQLYQEENKFIVEHFHKIKDYYDKKNKNFIYIPFVISELIQYYYPYIEVNNLDEEIIKRYIQNIYNFLFKLIDNKSNTSNFCGLITHSDDSKHSDLFEYYPFPDTTSFLKLKRTTHVKKIPNGNFEFGFNDTEFMAGDDSCDEWYYYGPGYWADEYFSRESKQLIKEVKEKIDLLNEMGVSQMVLQKLLSLETPQKLSSIVITPDFKIFLPEFNNIEIVMTPLPKSVFLLFLKHPEGILFKKLHDYKNELKQIYEQISSREDMIKSKQSINNLANPTSNSINEKCSRIREAFVKHFDDNIAKYYYITGERAMPKKIIIDRSLVEWK